jgi:hypothetical protein
MPSSGRRLRGAPHQPACAVSSSARAQSWRHVKVDAPERCGRGTRSGTGRDGAPPPSLFPRSTKINDEIEFGGEPD